MNKKEIFAQFQEEKITLEQAEKLLLELTQQKNEKSVSTSIPQNLLKKNKRILLKELGSSNAPNGFKSKWHSSSLQSPKLVQLKEIAIKEKKKEISKRKEIAVIGISGRFPGANNVQELWSNLVQGKNSITEVPKERWDIKKYFDANLKAKDKTYSKWGGFVSDIANFDPLFFNISPSEAKKMDPQQRLFLEESWRCIEDAGYSPHSLSSEKCGVFVGVGNGDYFTRLKETKSSFDSYLLTGSSNSILAARISYFLNLKGPNLAIDTACSSSLVAIHQACQGILNEECNLAIAGGVTLLTTQEMYLMMSKAEMLSKEGQCKTFDQEANGFVPAEAVGAILLKPLQDAIADRDNIYGVIKGSGINQDGATNGITAPSMVSQTNLELEVYRKFKVNPKDISYVEAHGTGTKLGDPIEVKALTNAFEKYSIPAQSCALGSIKTNIGHTLAAAGITGLIKVLLCLKYKKLVAHLNLKTFNEHIPFQETPFYLPTKTQAWETKEHQPRMAAVSSFGFSGTNCHMVLQEAPQRREKNELFHPFSFISFSAKTEWSLKERIKNFLDWLLSEGKSQSLERISYTLNVGRSHFKFRQFFVVETIEELAEKLKEFLAKKEKKTPQFKATGKSPIEIGIDFLKEAEINSKGKDNYRDYLNQLGVFYLKGSDIPWEELYHNQEIQKIPLPTYPFQKHRFWASGVEKATKKEEKNFAANSMALSYYQQVWKSFDSFETSVQGEDCYLIFDQDTQFKEELEKSVSGEFIVVLAGDTFQKKEDNLFQISNNFRDYQLLLEHLAKQNQIPTKILFLWSKEPDIFETNQQEMQQSIEALFYLAKSMINFTPLQKTQILYLYHSPLNQINPFQIGLAGFIKTIREECPSLDFRLVSFNFSKKTRKREILTLLENEWGQKISSPQVRYDGKNRYITKLVTSPVSDGNESHVKLPFRTGGVYFISGGFGGLGFIFAKYLAENYQAKLILSGRSDLTAEKKEKKTLLESYGAEVFYGQGDVANREELQKILTKGKELFSEIHGVLHSAGIIFDSFLIKKNETDFHQVLSPKVFGTIVLDELTQKEPLDFFVLFSSLAGVAGNVGQCDYSYGNCFMDAYAEKREQLRDKKLRNGKTISFNWPYWKTGGMQLSVEDEEYLRKTMGLIGLKNSEGIEAFEKGFLSGNTQWIVVKGEQEKFKQHLHHLYQKPLTASKELKSKKLEQSMPQEAFVAFLIEQVSKVTEVPSTEIELETPLEEYGLDSIMIRLLTQNLEELFGPLSKTLFFEYYTLGAVAEYLQQSYPDTLRQQFSASATSEQEKEVKKEAKKEVQPLPFVVKEKGNAEDVAIIGLSGRYPKADNLTQFWNNLQLGNSSITNFSERCLGSSLWDTDTSLKNEKAALIKDIDCFDPLFFSISPEEAKQMDPQERLFLEVAWATLEDAGYTRKSIRMNHSKEKQRKVGVFVGVTNSNYYLFGVEQQSKDSLEWASSSFSSIANRVSYLFNFQGPSISVDTMCSSSLTAIHLAYESLVQGDIEIALAGGVNLYSHPYRFKELKARGMLASKLEVSGIPMEQTGFIPGEGVGAVLLKPLAKAIEENDNIYAVIKGSAINHGGKTSGFQRPSPQAQAEVIQSAFNKSGIEPATLSYLEAQAIGAELADTIEFEGLKKVFASKKNQKGFCALGTLKPNIGHAESAAGIAQLTKVLLQLKFKQIVPTLKKEKDTFDLNISDSSFYIPEENLPWDSTTTGEKESVEYKLPRRAGVSSFGAGGSGAHIILEEFQPLVKKTNLLIEEEQELFLFSAKSSKCLNLVVQEMSFYLKALLRKEKKGSDVSLTDIAYTLQVGREEMDFRMAVIADSKDDLLEKLAQVQLLEKNVHGLFEGVARPEFNNFLGTGIYTEDFFKSLFQAKNYETLAKLWIHGVSLPWNLFLTSKEKKRVSLPSYPFERRRCWFTSTPTQREKSFAKSLDNEPLAEELTYLIQDMIQGTHTIEEVTQKILFQPKMKSKKIVRNCDG